ncbi:MULTISPECIES: RluA family pseudouridine synthase [unclassified Arsukibacterium]|uniref:RluA family pseudouridine synthase n=1 Tax=unclassified Arsukibacterium TaxID=2635278 RepID=UPI000C47F4E5|nr:MULTISPECIES: RluA family pseudouridine synthase [unclassified Arsukibacterium]MAA93099.1 RNA pseudouridine synthase [Rheinheimera sp.]MBM35528.1 RNA pseudouridine synthase [Rheinheimera sp.]HAW93559.1 RNA pseudouridine synthase [Candidatus Azambacteria bacterium]|tara:strand:- start:98744 stop:99604 length:861 start_codon:yes stop_codon:yes gene_type:complete
MKLSRQIDVQAAGQAISILAAAVPELAKGRLKDAMSKGAVQLLTKPVKRLRRSQYALKAGQVLQLHYDADILSRSCPPARLISDFRAYSIWFKPAGMLSQGNEWGDHLSLLRFTEQHFGNRPVFLLHRLDREASGLVLIAHTRAAATAFSKLIAAQQLTKTYLVQVKGQLSPGLLAAAEISKPLDGKACLTRFVLRCYDAATDSSWLEIDLISGRKHQIRRHFAAVDHPVMGDPRYGEGNKNQSGLALQASAIAFTCPLQHHQRAIALSSELQLTGFSELSCHRQA